MELKASEKASNLESLFVALVNSGYGVSLDDTQKEITLWVDDLCFVITDSGKWRLD